LARLPLQNVNDILWNEGVACKLKKDEKIWGKVCRKWNIVLFGVKVVDECKRTASSYSQ